MSKILHKIKKTKTKAAAVAVVVAVVAQIQRVVLVVVAHHQKVMKILRQATPSQIQNKILSVLFSR